LIVPAAVLSPVFAYIGPGIGVGAIAVALGFIASIFLAVFAVLWYPLRRLFRRRNKRLVIKTIDES